MRAPKGLDVPFFCVSSAEVFVRSLPREGSRIPGDLGCLVPLRKSAPRYEIALEAWPTGPRVTRPSFDGRCCKRESLRLFDHLVCRLFSDEGSGRGWLDWSVVPSQSLNFAKYRPTAAPETTTTIQAARDLMCRELLESMYLPNPFFRQAKKNAINAFFTQTTFPQGFPQLFQLRRKTPKTWEKQGENYRLIPRVGLRLCF
jgi:hypothetical protein